MDSHHDNVINNLSPDDALAILRQLAARDKALAAEIAALALAYLSNVEAKEVTAGLVDELEDLTPEEVWDRAGNTRDGYVEPGEAAEEMIQEVVGPYLEEMRKYHETGLGREAAQMCMGLLHGFYLFEYESKTEFNDWAIDAPLEFAREVLAVWQEGESSGENRQEVQEFIDAEMPRWAGRLLSN